MAMEWYIIRVAKGQDRKVKTSIEEQLVRYKVSELVQDIVIPTEKEIKLRNGKKVKRDRAMLAGYVFVNADLKTNPIVVDIINDIPGSYGFMSDDPKNPMALKKADVDKMLGNMINDVESENKISWIKGERVKIIEGPFNGFDGSITDIDSNKNRLKVEVKVFGRATPMEVEYHAVEKVA